MSAIPGTPYNRYKPENSFKMSSIDVMHVNTSCENVGPKHNLPLGSSTPILKQMKPNPPWIGLQTINDQEERSDSGRASTSTSLDQSLGRAEFALMSSNHDVQKHGIDVTSNVYKATNLDSIGEDFKRQSFLNTQQIGDGQNLIAGSENESKETSVAV